MNKVFSTIVLLVLLSFNLQVSAHGGGHGAINDQQAVMVTAKTIKQMTFKDFGYELGQLDESWKNIKESDISVVEQGSGFFIVSANNSTQEKTIYFKIAANGQVLAANETNNFSEE